MRRRILAIYKIVADIKDAAIKYKTNLVGRTFLYAFDRRFIEVIFKASNFKHLKGVDSKSSADTFYRYSFKRKLTTGDIFFNKDHVFSF
ncbi:MAG: PBECR4 domain-containing protein [Bacilli bacterium]|nr:PBECR4 domain-containing protein [Bacilli bacterium]